MTCYGKIDGRFEISILKLARKHSFILVYDTPSNFVELCYSLQYYYKSVKEIINYVRNPIQFQGETKIFYIYTTKKILYLFFAKKSIGRYRLYLPIPILLADTTDTDTKVSVHPYLKYRDIFVAYLAFFNVHHDLVALVFRHPRVQASWLEKIGKTTNLSKNREIKNTVARASKLRVVLKVETTLNNYMYSNC